ncbi:MAG: hypothetical protein U9P11_06230 [Pseudomonadota bacterium]|nr:hypothetical protein [Pseudomonadota bacterium]
MSMANEVSIQGKKNKMSLMSMIPWTFFLIAYAVVVHVMGLNMEGIQGYVFIGFGMFVLFAEFFKSGDINVGSFLVDILFAVIAVVVATGLLSYLVFNLDQSPTFFYWLGYAIVIGDAILSPFNSFRTALRNFGVG